jgi:hemolysin III
MLGVEFREPASTLTHGLGCVLAVLGTVVLSRRRGCDRGRRVSLLIFGLSLIACFGLSTRYHGACVSDDAVLFLRRLDHIGIYGLIAGTYTPIAWGLMRGRWRRVTLAVAWGAALMGAGTLLVGGLLPIWLSTAIYLALGWGALFMCVEIARRHPPGLILPVVQGGVLYSVGAVINLAKWPILWPGVFEAHEVFHLFVMAGSACHYAFILRVVAVPSAPAREMAILPPGIRRDAARPGRPRLAALWRRRPAIVSVAVPSE